MLTYTFKWPTDLLKIISLDLFNIHYFQNTSRPFKFINYHK